MKTLGLIGGTSWVSTTEYYRIINQKVNEKLGGLNSAKLILYSMNLEEFKRVENNADVSHMASLLTEVAMKIEQAGADCLVICANTPHIVATEVQANISIPLINIAEVTVDEISKLNMHKVGLLGTAITMEKEYFKEKLRAKQIEPITPHKEERDFIQHSISCELGKGIFTLPTKRKYIDIITRLANEGAEGVILGCTEIPLLIKPEDCPLPVFNTTLIHASAAVDFALS